MAEHSPDTIAYEKAAYSHQETKNEETAHEAAERGHVATDK